MNAGPTSPYEVKAECTDGGCAMDGCDDIASECKAKGCANNYLCSDCAFECVICREDFCSEHSEPHYGVVWCHACRAARFSVSRSRDAYFAARVYEAIKGAAA